MVRSIRSTVFNSVGLLFSLPAYAGLSEDPDCNLLPACAMEASIARSAFEQADYNEALRRYRYGFSLVRDPRLLVNLGRVHFRMGQYQQSIEYYGRASGLAHDPDVISQVIGYTAEAEAALAQEKLSRYPVSLIPLSIQAGAPPATLSSRRPAWRWGVGFVSIGAGIVLGGIGASGLLLDGQSDMGQVYYTRLPAAVILGSSISLTAAGVLVAAIPSRAH